MGPDLTLSHSAYFFFIDAATTEIYTLSLHDALPISPVVNHRAAGDAVGGQEAGKLLHGPGGGHGLYRSEEHTSELQSRPHLVCRLLLEKKKHEYLNYLPDSQNPPIDHDLHHPPLPSV